MAAENPRYVVRPAREPNRFLIWDTTAEAIVFGGESLFANAAQSMAGRLNEQYARTRPHFCPSPP